MSDWFIAPQNEREAKIWDSGWRAGLLFALLSWIIYFIVLLIVK